MPHFFHFQLIPILFLLISTTLLPLSHCDVGTAAHYRSPYLPSACYGNDGSKYPTNSLFAAASEGLWDEGAACGRQYLVRCISAPVRGSCTGRTIQIRIVDRAMTSVSRPSRNGATLVLSSVAFRAIVNRTAAYVNVEFQQL